jgi:hypothetical protein
MSSKKQRELLDGAGQILLGPSKLGPFELRDSMSAYVFTSIKLHPTHSHIHIPTRRPLRGIKAADAIDADPPPLPDL